eukprot:1447382-Rhodomonas_salina.2
MVCGVIRRVRTSIAMAFHGVDTRSPCCAPYASATGSPVLTSRVLRQVWYLHSDYGLREWYNKSGSDIADNVRGKGGGEAEEARRAGTAYALSSYAPFSYILLYLPTPHSPMSYHICLCSLSYVLRNLPSHRSPTSYSITLHLTTICPTCYLPAPFALFPYLPPAYCFRVPYPLPTRPLRDVRYRVLKHGTAVPGGREEAASAARGPPGHTGLLRN